MNLCKKLGFIILFFLCSLGASAYSNPGSPTGFVNDYAGLFNAEEKQLLEDKLGSFEKESSNEISVVTINSLDGDTVENYAVELFKDWGIGKKKNDNGVLVLIAKDDRKMRIEVGYGLEGALTDAQSSWIISDIMKPAFKEEKYYAGVDAAADKIISATKGEYVPDGAVGNKSSTWNDNLIGFVIFAFFIILNILGTVLGRSKSYWAGGLIGLAIGALLGLLFGTMSVAIILAGTVGIMGLIFDYIVSRITGGGGGSAGGWWNNSSSSGSDSGGFDGFGGGSSGGGGASGDW